MDHVDEAMNGTFDMEKVYAKNEGDEQHSSVIPAECDGDEWSSESLDGGIRSTCSFWFELVL